MRARVGFRVGILTCAAAAGLWAPAAWAQPAPPDAPRAPRAPRARAVDLGARQASYLGIGVQDITPERAKALNLKEDRGAEVTSVAENSPAAKAGFKEGDVVLEYNGQAVQGTEQLTRLVRETPPERQVRITVWRSGSTQNLTATIAARRASMRIITPGGDWEMPEVQIPEIRIPQIDIPRFQMNWQSPMLGIVGESVGREQQLADFFGVKEGVLVRSVLPNSAAEKAGIKAGDIIVRVGDAKVATTEEIGRALRSVADKTTLTVTLVRNKKEMPVTVTVENTRRGGSFRARVVGFRV